MDDPIKPNREISTNLEFDYEKPLINSLQDVVGELIIQTDFLKTIFTEVDEKYKKDKKNFLLQLIEMLDAFDRIFKNIDSKSSEIDNQTNIWLGNFRTIKKLIEKALRQFGVEPIQTPDNKAIPGFHKIIETRVVSGMENDTIIDELVKGYLWDAEALRNFKKEKLSEALDRGFTWSEQFIKIANHQLVILRKSEVIVVKNY